MAGHHHQADVVRLNVVHDLVGRSALAYRDPIVDLDSSLFQLRLYLLNIFCTSIDARLGESPGLLNFNLGYLRRLDNSAGAHFFGDRHHLD